MGTKYTDRQGIDACLFIYNTLKIIIARLILIYHCHELRLLL